MAGLGDALLSLRRAWDALPPPTREAVANSAVGSMALAGEALRELGTGAEPLIKAGIAVAMQAWQEVNVWRRGPEGLAYVEAQVARQFPEFLPFFQALAVQLGMAPPPAPAPALLPVPPPEEL